MPAPQLAVADWLANVTASLGTATDGRVSREWFERLATSHG